MSDFNFGYTPSPYNTGLDELILARSQLMQSAPVFRTFEDPLEQFLASSKALSEQFQLRRGGCFYREPTVFELEEVKQQALLLYKTWELEQAHCQFITHTVKVQEHADHRTVYMLGQISAEGCEEECFAPASSGCGFSQLLPLNQRKACFIEISFDLKGTNQIIEMKHTPLSGGLPFSFRCVYSPEAFLDEIFHLNTEELEPVVMIANGLNHKYGFLAMQAVSSALLMLNPAMDYQLIADTLLNGNAKAQLKGLCPGWGSPFALVSVQPSPDSRIVQVLVRSRHAFNADDMKSFTERHLALKFSFSDVCERFGLTFFDSRHYVDPAIIWQNPSEWKQDS